MPKEGDIQSDRYWNPYWSIVPLKDAARNYWGEESIVRALILDEPDFLRDDTYLVKVEMFARIMYLEMQKHPPHDLSSD